MKIINFEKAKVRRHSKEKAKYLPEADNGVLELERQYREYAEYCNRWYDEHVARQDKDGSWIYKDS